MSYQVDSYGNAYFPAGVSVASIPATTGTQNKVLVPGPGGRISSASIAQLITQSGSNLVTSVYGRTGDVVPRQGDYDTDLVTEGQALYFTDSRARKALSVTTFNTSGPATYDSTTGIINIPQYGSGIVGNYVPITRTITINGQTADLSANRIFSIDSMVYPSAGIPLSNGTSWGTSIVNNSANWNTAYGWGDHSVEGYLTSFTETDPTVASHIKAITTTNITNWNSAYSWGNHALAGYLTSFVETDPVWTSEKINYYTKLQADARYLQSYTETDPVWTSEKANYALKTYVDTSISNLIDSAPTTLDTLNELAAALGDDANFSTTITNLIGTKEPAITAGTTAQYWRGDKTWQTLPVYTLSGLGGVPTTRTLTINGTSYDLSADRSWSIAAGVTSFNTRTGAITLSSADVTGALGYTPYNSTNPNGYITGITSTMVTNALGYTPYNSSNPNGYITGISFANVSAKPTTLSGYGITDSLYQASQSGINVNAFNGTGLYRGSTGDWSNRPTITDNSGALLQIDTHPGNYHTQLFFDSSGSRLYLRSAIAGTWGSWLTMWHSGNLTNLNQLTNGPGYITGYTETDTLATVTSRGNTTNGSINVNGNILLTGSVTTTNQARTIDFTGFDKEGVTDFSDRAYIQHTTNTGGHAGTVLVISSENDADDGIAFLTNPSSKLKHNSNNLATESYVTSQGYITSSGSISGYAMSLNGYANQTEYTILTGPANGPVIKVRYDSATANRYIDIGSKDGNGVYYEGFKIYNGSTPTWGGSTIWHQGNLTNLNQLTNGPGYITSSATTLTLTGNLTVSSGNTTGGGIILADDGDIVDLNDAYCSMRFSAGVRIFSANRGGSAVITLSNTGSITANGPISASNISTSIITNYIVQRDANGYIYANHINFNTSENENPTISSFITSNGDGWSRKSNLAHVKNSIRGVADGTWGISISGSAAQLGGWSLQNVVPYHSGSDFPNGTLVVTSINASVTYGDSFVMEVTGKSYGSGAGPFALLLEGYIYADTFINVGALSYGGYFPGPIRIFNYGGNLAFWWPRASYWNSFSVKVREAGGSASNRVTSISDSGEPSSSKKVSITPVQSLHSSNYNSYSPTLTGGNASGTWGINITGSASTLSNNATISGLNFGGVLALTGSGASTGNSTGARLSESYGPIWNLSNGATWHHQVINGSYLSGISAGGGNYGSGNYYGTGDVTAYYSDERLKTKITIITDAIEKIKSLEGFVYVENELARSLGYNNQKEQAGVSAQQIQAVLPQAVSLAPFDMQGVPETGEIISKTGENYLTVKYDRIVPLLIEGIKEQQAQIEELKNEIKELKNK